MPSPGQTKAVTETNLKIRRPRLTSVFPPRGSLSPECAALLENRGLLQVLDIGCGHAKYRQFVTECGHRYVGVDLCSRQADIWCDVHALPFSDTQFDAAFLFAVLQYSLHPQLVLAEATLLEEANFRLEYIWPSWNVFEAVSCASRQKRPQSLKSREILGKIERALESGTDVFQGTLDFSGAIYFHAVKIAVPARQPTG
jgi:SAM-dependent methyltransferase